LDCRPKRASASSAHIPKDVGIYTPFSLRIKFPLLARREKVLDKTYHRRYHWVLYDFSAYSFGIYASTILSHVIIIRLFEFRALIEETLSIARMECGDIAILFTAVCIASFEMDQKLSFVVQNSSPRLWNLCGVGQLQPQPCEKGECRFEQYPWSHGLNTRSISVVDMYRYSHCISL